MIKLDVEAKGKGVIISGDIVGRGDKVAREASAILQELGETLPREMWLEVLLHYLEHLMGGDNDENEE